MSKGNLMNTYGRFNVVFEYGKGSKIYDKDGKEYLDFVSGVAVNCLGHSHPVIVSAIRDQSEKLMQISNYYWNTPAIELSELIVSHSNHKEIFFCNSGTEAIEAAIKIGRKYGRIHGGKNKNVIIHMDNSFHGRTMGALTITGQEKYQKDFTPLIGGVESVKFNDIDDLKQAINEDVCAVIIEPIQGEGGINPVSIEYIKNVRKLCDDNDMLLIFDEVQCGIGRLGTLFAYEKFGVIPDVVCMAKGLGGGFPIGAAMAVEKACVLNPGDHGSTFGGNPLACAVSLAVLKELLDGGVIAEVDTKSEYIKKKLTELKIKYPVIKEIKGTGLLIGIAVTCDPKSLITRCFDKGLLVVTAGKDVVRLLPPLNVNIEDIDSALDVIEEVLKENA